MSLRFGSRLFTGVVVFSLAGALVSSRPISGAEPAALDSARVRSRALYCLAVTHMVGHRYDEALAAFLQAWQLDPSDPEPGIKAAGILLAAHKSGQALELLEGIRDRFPLSFRVRALLAVSYQQQDRLSESVAEFREGIRLGLSDAATFLALAGILLEQEVPEEAREVLEQGAATCPENPQFPLKLGAMLLNREEFEAAIAQFRRALVLEPESTAARSLLAWALDRAGRPDEAIAEYEETIRLGQEEAVDGVYEHLARLYMAAGRYNMAAGKLRVLLLRDRENSQLHSLLGAVEYLRGDYEASREALERALALGENDGGLLTSLGLVYEKLGRFNDAVRVLEEAIAADPNRPGPYNDLGYFYAERGIKLDEAEELVLRALELAPDEPAFLDSLGWVYYARGQYERALESLQRAAELDPEEPEIQGHLGDAFFRLGDVPEARERWEKALELDHPEPDSIRERLEVGLPPAPADQPR